MRPKFFSPIALFTGCSMFLTVSSAFAQDDFDWTPGITVPDDNPVGIADTRNITFDPRAVITDLEVRLHLTGGWNGDLYASLVHDSGFTVLLNRPGNTSSNPAGSGSSGMNVTFSDIAISDIHTGIPGSGFVTGTWQPDARTADPSVVTDLSTRSAFLSSFNDAPVQGNWTLFLADNAASDVSVLTGWGLSITSELRDYAIWDANGNTAGIGGAGTWSSSSSTWATSNVGTSTNAHDNYAELIFNGVGGAVDVSGTVSPEAGMRFITSGYTIAGGTIEMAGASASANRIVVDSGVTSSISSTISGSNGMTVSGGGTLILSANNTLTGDFNLDQGVLSVSNTTGSATGAGQLTVAAGAVLAGNGIIAPATGTDGIHIAGDLAPGEGIGMLTFDLSATMGAVVLAPNAGLIFELGAPNASMDTIGLNSSDLIRVTGASDFEFNLNVIDFGLTGGNGFYKLFDTTGDSAALWSGLTFDAETGLVSSGLSYVNLDPDLSGTFLVGTTENGGDLGDIYFHVIPETHTALLGGLGVLVLLRRRRTPPSTMR